jgi:hypothetical protein
MRDVSCRGRCRASAANGPGLAARGKCHSKVRPRGQRLVRRRRFRVDRSRQAPRQRAPRSCPRTVEPVREVVMAVVEVDPLAVLPITAAAANAAFARATDPGRDLNERQEQLRSLRSSLTTVRRHLDRCEQAAARLAAELDSTVSGRTCSAGWAVCRHYPAAPARCSTSVDVCPRCERTGRLDRGRLRCSEPSTVVLRDATAVEQALCLSHAAAAIRRTPHLAVVSASRPDRAVLGEVTRKSCVVSRHASLLLDAQGGPRGG